MVGRIESKIWHSGICRVAAALSKVKITLLCMSTHANHRVQAHRITSLTLRRAWKKNLNGYFLLFARTRGSFITTPRRGTRSRKESNRERSSAHTYQSLRRGTGQRVDWIVCASTPRQIKAVGVDSKIQDIFFGPSFATLTLALRSAVRPARLLREPSSVDYQAKRGVEHWMEQRGDKIKHASRKRLRVVESGGSSFFDPFPLQAASRHHFLVCQPFFKGSVSSYKSSSTLPCTIQHKHEYSHHHSQ